LRICYACGSQKTFIDKFGEHWVINKGTNLVLCQRCYGRHVYAPIHNRKKLYFKPLKKEIWLKECPRTGICSWCGKEGRTEMHHIEYHIEDVLKDTIELCTPCHNKESARLGQTNRDTKTGRFMNCPLSRRRP